MTTEFDPSRALVFDLNQGTLRDDEGNARVNLPAAALLRLCEQAGPEAQKDFAQSLGSDLGRRIFERLEKGGTHASLELWASHLGGHLALIGLGDLSIEQWGKALVLSVSDHPKTASELVGQLLRAALQRALGRDTALVSFESGTKTSYLVVAPQTENKVKTMVQGGAGLGQVIEQLHRGAA